MKAFDFLLAVCELGIRNSSDKEAPAACVLNDNQYIFIYEME